MSDTFDLDLGDTEHFASDQDEMMAAIECAARLFESAMERLKAPTPSEKGLAEVLDFFAPWGPARACFYAVCVLQNGRLSVADGEDFDVIAARVRRQCRDLMASGRVKAAGQPRTRTPKPAPETQGDLFGLDPLPV